MTTTAMMSRETAIEMHRQRARRALAQAYDYSLIALGLSPNYTHAPRSEFRAMWRQAVDRAAHHRRMLAVEKSYVAVAYVDTFGAHYGAVAS